jgi:hypothetical protein
MLGLGFDFLDPIQIGGTSLISFLSTQSMIYSLETSWLRYQLLVLWDRLAVDRVGVFFDIWNNTHRYMF